VPIHEFSMYRTRDEILDAMLAGLTTAIPDAYVGEDGVTRIILTIEAGQLENLFLANQLVLQDSFIATAHYQALRQYGEQYGVEMKQGTRAEGVVRFEGEGGTFIPAATEIAFSPAAVVGNIYFLTTAEGTIPNPGNPTAPGTAIGAAGVLNGTYEHAVSFVTQEGETLIGPPGLPMGVVNQQVNLTNIPLGGPGTISRRIYRDKNGSGVYHRVVEILDNTTVVYNDNVADATVAVAPEAPAADAAHFISLPATASETGAEGNVGPGTITELVDAPSSLIGVTNPAPFSGGSDAEDIEEYRLRLIEAVRAPFTASAADYKRWAEEFDDVDSATVYQNDNLGTAANGHVTVRIVGKGSTIPDAALISEVQASLEAQQLVNLVVHVTSFDPVVTNVTVDVTTTGGFTVADVTTSVQAAVSEYISGLLVGETFRVAGVTDAVYGLSGILDVVVTAPTTNQTTGPTQKRIPGTITVV
jgi:uncharacterized phage protein gp47/JayE